MKKIFALLAIIIFLSGCVNLPSEGEKTELQPEKGIPGEEEVPAIAVPEGPAKEEKPPEPAKEAEEKPEAEQPEEVQTKFNLGEGKSIEINKTKVTVKEIHSDGKVLLEVGGENVWFVQTMQDEITKGVDLKLLKFHHFGASNPENYIELEAKPLALGPNEYLLKKNWEKVTINGSMFELLDVGSTDRWVWVSISGKVNKVVDMGPGSSKKAENFKVTSVRQFYLAPLPYAIVRIEQI